MSPEQVRGQPTDRRSDLFALGVIFYEMLTGERLFLGESDYSTLEAVRAARVPAPSIVNAKIPLSLERIALKLLARDPTPHRTRRIRKRSSGCFEIGCGAWRATFVIEAETVTVTALETGYPLRFLMREGYEAVPDREAQLAFLYQWPESRDTSENDTPATG
jgi:serine/threonine protein kinase